MKGPKSIAVWLFIFMEIFAVGLTIFLNTSKRLYTLNGISTVSAFFYTKVYNIVDLFNIKKEYHKLLEINKKFLTKQFNCPKNWDTTYNVITAKVIKNSVQKMIGSTGI